MNTSYPDLVFLTFGSFNPPTPNHFRIFEIARDHFQQINKSRIVGGIIVPISDNPVNKSSKVVSIEHRCCMINLILKSSSWIKLSNQTIKPDNLFSIRNILSFHQDAVDKCISDPEESNISWLPQISKFQDEVKVTLLGSVDLLERQFNARNQNKKDEVCLEYILKNYGLVIVSDSNISLQKIVFDSDLLDKYKCNITLITNWASNEISSALVRRLIARKHSVKYLLDDPVIDYINKNNLYTDYIHSSAEEKAQISLPTALKSNDRIEESIDASHGKQLHQKALQGYVTDYNGDLSKFLKFAIETKRIKAVRKEQCFV